MYFKTIKSVVLSLVLGTSIIASVSAQDVLKIGTEGAYPPFNEIDSDGNLIGFDIDIANAICDAMNRECEFITQDWDGIIPGLLARKYDVIIASMSITKDRQRVIDFTRPYYQTPAKFAAAVGAFADDDPDTLDGVKVGVQRATIHQTYLEDIYPDADLVLYGTQDELHLDLKAGRIEAGMADSIVFNDGFLATPEGEGFAFFGGDHSIPKYHGVGVGVGLRKGQETLRDEISAAIETIYANGTYKEINDKYFDFSVWVNMTE